MLFRSAMLEIKAQSNIYSLDFDPEKYSVQTFTFDEKEYKVRAYENIVYVENPIDTTYQKINIYVREEYFSDQKINGFDKETAPVFLPNGVGGYMPSQPLTLNRSNRNIFGIEQRGQRQMPPQAPQGDTKQGSAIHYALARGFVVASPGARGRSVKNSAGVYTGKAPAGLVDLKAAISILYIWFL